MNNNLFAREITMEKYVITRNAICQLFLSWHRQSWKSLTNPLTRDPEIVIYGNSWIILEISIANAMEILQFCT